MKVLIVEDDATFMKTLEEGIARVSQSIQVSHAESRDEARNILNDDIFDLVVLDLNIPSDNASLDADVDHGHAVLASVQKSARGTPVSILTGSSAEEHKLDYYLKLCNNIDLWASGKKVETISFCRKYELDRFFTEFTSLFSMFSELPDIEVDFDGAILNLDLRELRLIQIFCRKSGGSRCSVKRLSGGLSGTLVLRIQIYDSEGRAIFNAVAKIGTLEDIEVEDRNYQQFVNRLARNASPRKLDAIYFGAKDQTAVFYELADSSLSIFDISHDVARSKAAIEAVKEALNNWHSQSRERRTTVGDIRRCVLSDEDKSIIIEKFGLAWANDFEVRNLQARWCLNHGDLHGQNALVDEGNTAVVIDYADIAEMPAALDPVTLELSILCHVEAPLKAGDWPREADCLNWVNVDEYVPQAPCREFIVACREWATNVSAGQREILACAYSYLLRQLKYEDTNTDLVLSLLEAVRDSFD